MIRLRAVLRWPYWWLVYVLAAYLCAGTVDFQTMVGR